MSKQASARAISHRKHRMTGGHFRKGKGRRGRRSASALAALVARANRILEERERKRRINRPESDARELFDRERKRTLA